MKNLALLAARNFISVIGLTLLAFTSMAQEITQSVIGRVIDEQTGASVPGATIILVDTTRTLGTTSDMDGNFVLEGVPIGRQSFRISFIGYKPMYINNVTLNSAKQLNLGEVSIAESIAKLKEVAIVATVDKEKPLNEMAMNSARTFSLDEASRFAGAAFDPARMVTNFAGVQSSGDTRNDIIVRGNSPNAVQYRLEGIPTPNPNHFGTYGGAGGAVSMISQNMLATSDFLTGAFPAEYGNVNGGVFDINFKNGNSQEHEFTGLFSFRGAELTAEGPVKVGSNSSFIANYRYSTLGIFDALSFDIGVPAVPEYQDFSFKVDVPTSGKLGRFTLFGLGGIASINLKDSDLDDPEEYFNQDQPGDIYNQTAMAIVGLNNTHFFGKKTTGKLTLGYSLSRDEYTQDTLNTTNFETTGRLAEGTFNEDRFITAYKLKHKLTARTSLQAGTYLQFFDLDFDERVKQGDRFEQVTDYAGTSSLTESYVGAQHKFTDDLVATGGLHHTYYDITESSILEPRAGLKWSFLPNQSISASFGMHSQILPQYVYFIQEEFANGDVVFKNRDLDLMKSRHYVLGYDWSFAPSWRIKAEGYYQDLYDIPVEVEPSSFSAINTGSDFEGFPEDLGVLENTGTGYNYGVELTLEKFFSKGTYLISTTSLFNSRYEGSDKIERNTAFNQGYVLNVLAGKEWAVGKSKNNVFGVNIRSTFTGGRRYTPVNRVASQEQQTTVLFENRAFEEQYDPYFRTDLRLSYNINKKKVSHQFALDFQNVTNNQNVFAERYNVSTNTITTEYQQGFLPDLQYRILF